MIIFLDYILIVKLNSINQKACLIIWKHKTSLIYSYNSLMIFSFRNSVVHLKN